MVKKSAMSAPLVSMSTAVLLASSAIGLLMSPALSADLPTRKAPPPPAPVLAAFSWTGFYVGGVAGYEQNSNGANETSSDYGQLNNDGSFNCSQCGYDNGARIYNLTAVDQHFTAQGFGIGGTAGYNYQVSPQFLIGIETDLSWWSLKGSANSSNNDTEDSFFGQYYTNVNTGVSSGIDVFGTLRARAGFLATPTTLLFASGGLAYGQVNAHLNNNGSVTWLSGFSDDSPNVQQVPFGTNASTTEFKAGWTVGGGIEQKLDAHWSIKAEYLYYDLGSVDVTNEVTAPRFLDHGQVYVSKTNSYDFKGNIGRIGLNYTF